MNRQRLIVVTILLLTSTVTSYVVFKLSVNAEQQTFDNQYNAASRKLLESFERLIDHLGIVNTIGISATIEGLRSAESTFNTNTLKNNSEDELTGWPFVTLPNFPQKAASVRELSGALYLSLLPIVQEKDRTAWEEYVVQDHVTGWM